MSELLSILMVVACSKSLLSCEQMDARPLAFSDAGRCREAMEQIIEQRRSQIGTSHVIMGRCQFRIVRLADVRLTNLSPEEALIETSEAKP